MMTKQEVDDMFNQHLFPIYTLEGNFNVDVFVDGTIHVDSNKIILKDKDLKIHAEVPLSEIYGRITGTPYSIVTNSGMPIFINLKSE